MLRSMAGKLSPDVVTGPMSSFGHRVKLGKLGPLSDAPFNVRTLVRAGVIHSAGHNLFSSLSLCEFHRRSDLVRSKPHLGKLTRNGGPTETVALKRGSPAIGKAKRSAPGRDQRGRKRDRKPDIGAFER